MAQKYATVEVWVICDSDGDTATGGTPDEARESYEENVGPLNEQDGFRMVKVLIRVPLPETCIVEVEAQAPVLEAATATA
jgi:hypothetical protein